MASLQQRNGRFLIQFQSPTGKRLTLRLGKVTRKHAQAFRVSLEATLDEAAFTGKPSPQSVAWMSSLPSRTRKQLVVCGLLRELELMTLRQLCNKFRSQSGRKDSTETMYGHTIRNLESLYGPDTPITEIAARADEFRPFISKTLSGATVARRIRVARSIFALSDLTPNPFKSVKAGKSTNPARQRYVPREIVNHLISLADPDFAIVLSLSRFGGLRIPSEAAALRWSDIEWSAGTILVRSPKTEHHAGRAERVIPLFPELREILSEAFHKATNGSIHVLPGAGHLSNTAYRRKLTRLLKRAGVNQWPKLFHNMRASAETDWTKHVPIHVAACWAGHKPEISAEHYLMVTTDWTERAAKALHSTGSVSHQELRLSSPSSTTACVNGASEGVSTGPRRIRTRPPINRKLISAAKRDERMRRQRAIARAFSSVIRKQRGSA